MSEFLKRGAVGQAVGAGPLSPRSGRGNKTDNVFAYIFGKGIAKLAAFADTFTRGAVAGGGVDWTAVSGTWAVTANQATTATAAASYPVLAVDVVSTEATVKATLPTTPASGAGVSFWVTDDNNWWAAVVDKVSSTAAPYNCPSGGSANNNSGNCTYNVQGGGPYQAQGGGYYDFFYGCPEREAGGTCYSWTWQNWHQAPRYNGAFTPYYYYTVNAPYNYNSVTYGGTATAYNRADLKIIKKVAGTVSTVSTTELATNTASQYVNFVQVATTANGATITAQTNAQNTATAVNTALVGTPGTKFGLIFAPGTVGPSSAVESFELFEN